MFEDIYYCVVEDSCFCPYVVKFGSNSICQHHRKADYFRGCGTGGNADINNTG